MDFRKVIQLGNNTHVISLPKHWIDQQKVSKGDALITEIYGNSILFRTSEKRKANKKSTKISINKEVSKESIKRKLISAYENNATTIEFSGTHIQEFSAYITKLVEGFVGLEIIEQTTKSIVSKVYILSEDITIETFVKRIDESFRTIILELFDFYQSKNPALIEDIIQKNINLKKLSLMMKRVIRERLELLKVFEDNPLELLNFWDRIKILEKLSQIAVGFAASIKKQKVLYPSPDEAKKAKELFEKVLNKAYEKNALIANSLANKLRELKKELEIIKQGKNKKDSVPMIIEMIPLIRELNRLNY